MKRFFSLLLCAALLAGCGQLSLAPARPPSEPPGPQATPTVQPTRLAVCLQEQDAPLKALFEAYGAEQNVTVEYTDGDACDLAVLRSAPGDEWASLGEGPLYNALCGILEMDPAQRGLPLGQYGYGYLINTQLLAALLGEGALQNLQRASYEDWENFCDTLTDWIETPEAQTLTLNEASYTLPAQKEGAAANLSALFVLASGEQDCYGGEVLSYALAPVAEGEGGLSGLTADAFSGAAGALYDAFCLEQNSLYTPGEEAVPLSRTQAEEAFLNGSALFYRADTLRGSVLGGQGMALGLMGVKLDLSDEDIQVEGLDAEQLRSWPVTGPYRYLALRQGGSESEAQAFLYWLYASHQGQRLLTDTLGLVRAGLRSPSGEPGRSLAAFVEADEVLPAFSNLLDDGTLSAAAALVAAPTALAGDRTGREAYVQGLCALLCPAG